MAGQPERAEKLNHTLHWIIDILEAIDNCFVAYGTLLRITMEGSCIDGDDDIDICIDKEHWDDIHDLLKKKNMLTSNGN